MHPGKRIAVGGAGVSYLLAGSMLVLDAAPASAEWIEAGTPVADAVGSQYWSATAPDGEGGAFIAWTHDLGNISKSDVYAQRLDGGGNPVWAAGGVSVSNPMGGQFFPIVVPDGAGGVLIAWTDLRGGDADVYAMRLDGSGTPLWAPNGVAVAARTGEQVPAGIVADGLGGAIVAWTDDAFDVSDVYAQRVSATGTLLWAPGGVPVADLPGVDEILPSLARDDAGGVLVSWSDDRYGDYDVFGQRLDANGNVLWPAGLDFSSAVGTDEFDPRLAADGSGGGYVVWLDQRDGNADLYAARFNGFGAALWAATRAVVAASENQFGQRLLVSDTGDLIVTWQDFRSLSIVDIRAQRLEAQGGALRWPAGGVLLTEGTFDAYIPQITTDRADGAIIGWNQFEATDVIYAQRLDASGTPMWTGGGAPICPCPGTRGLTGAVSDGSGGAILVWDDGSTGELDVRAQRVEPREGLWGRPEPRIEQVADVPGDQGGFARVSWSASGHDAIPRETIGHYSIWRATGKAAAAARTRAAGHARDGAEIRVVDLADVRRGFEGPAFREAAGGYFWEYIGEQQAIYSRTYSFAAATEADSTSQNGAVHYFQVVAHALAPFSTFPSPPDSGYSVDNLSPGAPAMLNAQRVGGSSVDLDWNSLREITPDFGEYEIYRSATPGVPVDADHFLAATTDSVYTDESADPEQDLHYVVIAVDVHENGSDPSNEAMVSRTTGIDVVPPSVTGLRLQPNTPNPFTSTTRLIVGMPDRGSASLRVFDVAGRRVATRRYQDLETGWNALPFDGRDDAGQLLARGVYLYEVTALGRMLTRKMVIAR